MSKWFNYIKYNAVFCLIWPLLLLCISVNKNINKKHIIDYLLIVIGKGYH